MRVGERLWPALEAVVGPAAVAAQWRELLGEEFDRAAAYFRPAEALAKCYPRLGGGYRGRPYQVVQHGRDDFVAVCPETGDRFALGRADLVVYELDRLRLVRRLAAALGLRVPSGVALPERAGACAAGAYEPFAGYSFPVYLTFPLESRRLLQTVWALASASEGPFILMAPTRRRLQAESRAILERKRAGFLALAEAVDFTDSGTWGATAAARRELEAFREAHTPGPTAAEGTPFFPTPPAATWGDLRIRFLDGHMISAAVDRISERLHYAQLGMADGRNGRPTKQWDLLYAFARNRGLLDWGASDADRKNQKRRELLADDLRRFFRITGEPIRLTGDGKDWQTAFHVEPDV